MPETLPILTVIREEYMYLKYQVLRCLSFGFLISSIFQELPTPADGTHKYCHGTEMGTG